MGNIDQGRRIVGRTMLYSVPSAGLTAGQMKLIQTTIAVANEAHVLGDTAVLVTASEYIRLPKAAGVLSFVVGEQLYFDSGTGYVKKTSGGYYRCAVCKKAAALADTYVIAAFDGEHYTVM